MPDLIGVLDDQVTENFHTGGDQVHRYRSDLTEPEDKNDNNNRDKWIYG